MSTATLWDVSDDEYFSDTTAVSQSMLKDYAKSPALYFGRYVNGSIPRRSPSPEMLLGSALHCMALEPDAFFSRFAICPSVDRRTTAGKATWAKFCEEAAGKTVLTSEQSDIAGAMATALRSHKRASSLLEVPGMIEKPLRWTDESSGLRLKAKLDKLILPGDYDYPIVVDLKSAADPSPEGFARQAFNLNYHVQDAMYSAAAESMLGVSVLFLFVVVGAEPPHDVWVHRLDAEFARLGQVTLHDLLSRLARSYESDSWESPGQSSLSTISAPRWALRNL